MSPIEFTFAVAKGRRRYACTAKLLGEAEDAAQLDIDDEQSAVPEATPVRRRRTIVIAHARVCG